MDQVAIAKAAALLRACRDRGERITNLPLELRPANRAEAYAVQQQWGPDPTQLFGWKIAATSDAGQAHISVSGPLAGRLFRDRVIADGGTCPFGANQMKVAEIEFAFRMAQTLPPRSAPYKMGAVLAAAGSLHPAIEIPDSRLEPFEQAGAEQLIADNGCASYFVLGPPAPGDWRRIDLASHSARGWINVGPAHQGIGSNVLSDPRIALTWLANELSRHGLTLEAGQVVTTGTCLTPMPIAPGDRVVGDLDILGRVSVVMADA